MMKKLTKIHRETTGEDQRDLISVNLHAWPRFFEAEITLVYNNNRQYILPASIDVNHITTKLFILLVLCSPLAKAQELKATISMIQHPEWYLKVTDWSYFVAWAGVAMISNVTIENTADIAYKDIEIKLNYYSTSYGSAGEQVSSTTVVLPITVPPHSKNTYLKGGMPIGMGAQSYQTKYVQVLGAVPVGKVSAGSFNNTQKPKLTL